MKTFIKVILIFIFVGLSPIFIFFLSLKSSGFSQKSIKIQLIKEDVYTNSVNELYKQIDAATAENSSGDPLPLIGPFIKKEITAQYFQQKTENLIDVTSDWVIGKTNIPPVLSFQDLKEKLIKQNKPLLNTLIEMSREVKKQQEEAIRQAKENGENIPDQNIPTQNFDLEKLIKSDFSFPLDKYLAWLKSVYFFTSTGLFILAGVMFFVLVLILILSDSIKAKVGALGTIFLLSGLINLLPLLTFNTLLKFILPAFTKISSQIPPFVGSFTNGLISPVIINYLSFIKISLIGFFAIAIISFILFIINPFSTSKDKSRSVKQK